MLITIYPRRGPCVSYLLHTFDSTAKFPIGAIWRPIKTVIQIKHVSLFSSHQWRHEHLAPVSRLLKLNVTTHVLNCAVSNRSVCQKHMPGKIHNMCHYRRNASMRSLWLGRKRALSVFRFAPRLRTFHSVPPGADQKFLFL